MKDGLVKRGATWSYVVRVADPTTGRTRPRWVGGFPTEAAAKAERDAARVAARRGEYVDRAAVTVRGYLLEWLESHACSVKPKTLAGYRYDIEHYIIPRIGGQGLQGLRPATVSKMYRDISLNGGQHGGPLSARTVTHAHATLRKALNDAVNVEQLIASNPVERAKRPRVQSLTSARYGAPTSYGASSWPRKTTACTPSTDSPPTAALDAVSCCISAGRTWR